MRKFILQVSLAASDSFKDITFSMSFIAILKPVPRSNLPFLGGGGAQSINSPINNLGTRSKVRPIIIFSLNSILVNYSLSLFDFNACVSVSASDNLKCA